MKCELPIKQTTDNILHCMYLKILTFGYTIKSEVKKFKKCLRIEVMLQPLEIAHAL